MKKSSKTVFVGLSGGVDSSVAAFLLQKEGYNVVGVHIRCFNVDGCAEDDAEDARRVAETLGIPFYVFDFEKEYKEMVVEYMVAGYKQGITPNPDVMCNLEIKFGLFYRRALRMGADYVATGHYARTDGAHLLSGLDKEKDQTYFLWRVGASQLPHILFPLGGLQKGKVREIAKKARLHTATKKDSQGVCFLGEISLPEFLATFIPQKKGRVLGADGSVLGSHKGVHNFTIGQRHGLGIGGFASAQYVLQKDLENNTVVIGGADDERAFRKEIFLIDINELTAFKNNQAVLVRFRYRQPLIKARIKKANGHTSIVFDTPQRFIAEGQSAVLYDLKGNKVFGGGIIARTE
ncbi:MAG: tRNA 2-thiouridine(34) synthase MnmA [Candidatus Paceibacterota bacterium]